MSKASDQLDDFLKNLSPEVKKVLFQKMAVPDTLHYVIALLYGEHIIPSYAAFYRKSDIPAVSDRLYDGFYDKDIQKYFGEIKQVSKWAEQSITVTKQGIDQEKYEVDNWEEYEKILDVPFEAEKDDVLGAYAFPKSRIKKLPKEPNTQEETRLLKAIEAHLLESGNIPKDLSDIIVNILRSGKYSNIFQRCAPGTKIYRGMSVQEDWLVTAVKDNFNSENMSAGNYSGRMTFKPKSTKYSTSWTTDFDVSHRFRHKWHDPSGEAIKSYGVIMTSIVTDDMYALDCAKLYNEIKLFTGLRSEHEVICFDNVPCVDIEWYAH